MGFIDDALAGLQDKVQTFQQDAESYIGANAGDAVEAFVKSGAFPTGNLNQAQIDQGMRGNVAPIAAPRGQAYAAAKVAAQTPPAPSPIPTVSTGMKIGTGALIAIGIAAFILFSRKG